MLSFYTTPEGWHLSKGAAPPKKTGRIKTALYGDFALFRVQRDVVLEGRRNTKIMIIDI